MAIPKSVSELNQLIHLFETATLPRSEWKHAEHVIVAAWYSLHCSSETEAIEKVRAGIQKLTRSYGVTQTPTSGYHDTLTIFLTKKIWSFVTARSAGGKLVELELLKLLGETILEFSDVKALVNRHYHAETFQSWEARTGWIEPDREPV